MWTDVTFRDSGTDAWSESRSIKKMEQGLLLPREKEIPQCVLLIARSDQPVWGVWPLCAFHSTVSVWFPLPALVCHLLFRLLHLSWEQLTLRDGVRNGPRAHDDRTKPLPLTALEKDGKKGKDRGKWGGERVYRWVSLQTNLQTLTCKNRNIVFNLNNENSALSADHFVI